MKNWRYLILSLVLSLFIHYYVTAVLMEIFGMGWYYGSWTEWIVFAFNIGYFMFMPWVNGLFISSNKENFIVSVFIGFLCEFMQLIFHRGVFDLGDISLYVVGILLGIYVKEKYHVHLKQLRYSVRELLAPIVFMVYQSAIYN